MLGGLLVLTWLVSTLLGAGVGGYVAMSHWLRQKGGE